MKELLQIDAVKLIDKLLPANSSKSGLQFSQSQNMIVTTPYTSLAGNTYFNGIRLSDRIYIIVDIGIGWAHTFLNGLRIFANQNSDKVEVGRKFFHCVIYNEMKVKSEAKTMIEEKLKREANEKRIALDPKWLTTFVNKLIEDTYRPLMENLSDIQGNKLLTN